MKFWKSHLKQWLIILLNLLIKTITNQLKWIYGNLLKLVCCSLGILLMYKVPKLFLMGTTKLFVVKTALCKSQAKQKQKFWNPMKFINKIRLKTMQYCSKIISIWGVLVTFALIAKVVGIGRMNVLNKLNQTELNLN